jgi:hypothetical protein
VNSTKINSFLLPYKDTIIEITAASFRDLIELQVSHNVNLGEPFA